MSFDMFDFTESLERVGISIQQLIRCSLAFGHSPEGFASWEGGFVVQTNAGEWFFVFGWCDTTGWGCQDAAFVRKYTEHPTQKQMADAWEEECYGRIPLRELEHEPIDVNRFIKGEIDKWGELA